MPLTHSALRLPVSDALIMRDYSAVSVSILWTSAPVIPFGENSIPLNCVCRREGLSQQVQNKVRGREIVSRPYRGVVDGYNNGVRWSHPISTIPVSRACVRGHGRGG